MLFLEHPQLDLRELVGLEEERQSRGISEVALDTMAIAGGFASWGGPDHWASSAMGLGLAAALDDHQLDSLIGFYGDHRAPARIDVCPYAHPAVVPKLKEAGFRLHELESTLFRPLPPDDPLLDDPPAGPPGLEVMRVDPGDRELLAQAADVASSGFRPPGSPPDPVTARLAAHPLTATFAARLDGRLVGAGFAVVRGRIGSLFLASVLAEARRRGVQHALMIARLRHLREQGASVASVASAPGGPSERNALRLGFCPGYLRVTLERAT